MGLGLYILYRNSKHILARLGEFIERKVRKIYEFKKVNHPRRRKLYVKLTKSQKEAIDEFWLKNFGERIPYNWHELYTSYTGKFDEKYFPEFLYIPLLERLWNTDRYKYALEDKNLLSLIISDINGVVTPKMLVRCVNGVLQDKSFNFINEQEAENIIKCNEYVFVKPSIDSGSGIGCEIINSFDISVKYLKEKYNKNFCVQEIIKGADALNRIYPYGVNTFRVVSYLWNNKVNVAPIILRLGRNKNYLDNAHAGGIFIGVKSTGELMPCGFNEFQERFYKHPDTNVLFSGIKILEYNRIIESVKMLHARLPYLNIINWDITINKDNEIVVVEINTYDGGIWLTQMANGEAMFGENTSGILQMLKKYK